MISDSIGGQLLHADGASAAAADGAAAAAVVAAFDHAPLRRQQGAGARAGSP